MGLQSGCTRAKLRIITYLAHLADGGRRGEVREHGQIANTPATLTRLLNKLARPGAVLRLCYEAGPCGYGIQRHLSAAGHECVVVVADLPQAG